jgi:ketosteroid isomerase-like protein
MIELSAAARALKRSFDDGDRGPWEALMAPVCVNWHNHDKVEQDATTNTGAGALQSLVSDLHIDIVQNEPLSSGELIRFVMQGKVRSTGGELDAHQCVVITTDQSGRITRIDDYVDPTLGTQLGFPPA